MKLSRPRPKRIRARRIIWSAVKQIVTLGLGTKSAKKKIKKEAKNI
jgi:hypothetical protein